jgi:copper chaperone
MLELTIPTMTCGHCVRTVTETLKRLDPQADVQIELTTHRVRIESTQPEPAIRAALGEEGYAPA